MKINLPQIVPNPNQPRKWFDPEALHSLAESIKGEGLIEPIVVQSVPHSNLYLIIAGERRWRASCALALANRTGDLMKICEQVCLSQDAHIWLREVAGEIEATIREPLEDKDLLMVSSQDNHQQKPLNPIEYALLFEELRERHGLTGAQIAHKFGMSRPNVVNYRGLLRLPKKTQDMVASGEISFGQGIALAQFHALPENIKAIIGQVSSVVNPVGVSVYQIREDVTIAVKVKSESFGGREYLCSEDFSGIDDVKQPSCQGCPLLHEGRCFDLGCFTVKRNINSLRNRKIEPWEIERCLSANLSSSGILDKNYEEAVGVVNSYEWFEHRPKPSEDQVKLAVNNLAQRLLELKNKPKSKERGQSHTPKQRTSIPTAPLLRQQADIGNAMAEQVRRVNSSTNTIEIKVVVNSEGNAHLTYTKDGQPLIINSQAGKFSDLTEMIKDVAGKVWPDAKWLEKSEREVENDGE